MFIYVAVVLCFLPSSWTLSLDFPPGFKFGAATSSYQIEGAWNVSDKSENIWDRYTHSSPDKIFESANGDVACDSYNLWERDVEIAAELGLHFYRFSISWARLLPYGFSNRISEDGKRYYSNLIDGLLEKGIEPLVTLYHWDLPQSLQDLGGWTNPLIVEWFADYARVVYSLYADRVKTWITINEPVLVCELPYNTGTFAPGILSPDIGAYLCNKHVLLAHAKAWRIYDEEYKPKHQGKVTIGNMMIWMGAYSEEENELAELVRQNFVGRYSHAIFSKDGGWPPSIEEALAKKSQEQGFSKSKLPAFTEGEIELIRGTYDFLAINYYSSSLVSKASPGEKVDDWPIKGCPDLDAKLQGHPNWETMAVEYFKIYPEGLRSQLRWLKENYGDIEFRIMENGYYGVSGLNDEKKIKYINDHLKQILLSIKEDGVNITAYTVWSLIDNFEWIDAYKAKFGLYEVDFSSPKRTRTPRASAHYYRKVIKKNSLDIDHEEL